MKCPLFHITCLFFHSFSTGAYSLKESKFVIDPTTKSFLLDGHPFRYVRSGHYCNNKYSISCILKTLSLRPVVVRSTTSAFIQLTGKTDYWSCVLEGSMQVLVTIQFFLLLLFHNQLHALHVLLMKKMFSLIRRDSHRRGPTGPSSLAPATQDKMHPFIIIQWICATVNALTLL